MKLEFLESEACQNEIKILPRYHQIAFLASICERLIPLYEIFARESGWDDASFPLVRNCLDEIWLFIEHKTLDEWKFRRLLLDCEQIIVDRVTKFRSQ